MRGCINCDASKEMKEKTGHEYGFDHENMARCILRGCYDYGYAIFHPFIDPEEMTRIADGLGPEAKEAAKLYCSAVQERFGRFYREIGLVQQAAKVIF